MASSQDETPFYGDFQVGWICALPKELAASQGMFDEIFQHRIERPSSDPNRYVGGRMSGKNVVMTCLREYGNVGAAATARDMSRTFEPHLKFILMVGIGGGVPENKVKLGDVVVGYPEGPHSGVIQYDLGAALSDGRFEIKGILEKPPPELLNAANDIRAEDYSNPLPPKIFQNIRDMQRDNPNMVRGYSRPDGKETLTVHYGIIASGNSVVKDEQQRTEYNDRIKELSHDAKVLCYEMEGAGVVASFKAMVIRGICDYCDSQKNDTWQNHAAAVAASYAKELLQRVHLDPPRKERSQSNDSMFSSGEPIARRSTHDSNPSDASGASRGAALQRRRTQDRSQSNASASSSGAGLQRRRTHERSQSNASVSPSGGPLVRTGTEDRILTLSPISSSSGSGPSEDGSINDGALSLPHFTFKFAAQTSQNTCDTFSLTVSTGGWLHLIGLSMKGLAAPLPASLLPTDTQSRSLTIAFIEITDDVNIKDVITEWGTRPSRHIKFGRENKAEFSGNISSGNSPPTAPLRITLRVVTSGRHRETEWTTLKQSTRDQAVPVVIVCFHLNQARPPEITRWLNELKGSERRLPQPLIVFLALSDSSPEVRPQRNDTGIHNFLPRDYCLHMARKHGASIYVEIARGNKKARDTLFCALLGYAAAQMYAFENQ